MGKELYCDFCRASAPLEDSLKAVSIGDEKLGDACLTCASQMQTGIKKTIAEVTVRASAPPVAPPVAPQPAAAPPPADKAAPPAPREGPATAGVK